MAAAAKVPAVGGGVKIKVHLKKEKTEKEKKAKKEKKDRKVRFSFLWWAVLSSAQWGSGATPGCETSAPHVLLSSFEPLTKAPSYHKHKQLFQQQQVVPATS